MNRFDDCRVLPIDVDLDEDVAMSGLRAWESQRFRPELQLALRIRLQQFRAFFITGCGSVGTRLVS